jgi:hypothetical protein
VIPSFETTQNADFESLLLTWRDKVFMPAAVESHHRDLMYKPSKHPILTNEPGVTVTMDDGEEIKLEPRDGLDKPMTKKALVTIARVLKNNQSDADWNNLIPFLKGLVLSKRKCYAAHGFPQKITRNACEVDKDHIILSCVEKPQDTGMSLRLEMVARELMLRLHERAAVSNFDGPGLEAIYRRAEHLARMLEDQMHNGGKPGKHECDPRTDPVIQAILLELAAERVINKYDGEDRDGKVGTYATKLIHLIQHSRDHEFGTEKHQLAMQNHELVESLPIQNSIKWALKVQSVEQSELGKQLKAELESLTPRIERMISNVREFSNGQPRRGLEMYDQLNGGGASSAQ